MRSAVQQGIFVPSNTFYDTIYYWYVSTLRKPSDCLLLYTVK